MSGAEELFVKVSKDKFVEFIKSYGSELDYDVTGICEPPLASYNDFRGGIVWPESMVAKIILNEAMSGHPAYKGEPNDYYIRKNAPQNNIEGVALHHATQQGTQAAKEKDAASGHC